jgi:hypothetical protein
LLCELRTTRRVNGLHGDLQPCPIMEAPGIITCASAAAIALWSACIRSSRA